MYNWTYILLILAFILALYAQAKVRGSYNRFSKVGAACGLTGAQVARKILDQNGLYTVRVEKTQGVLSDHYDPRSHTVRLSPGIYGEPTIAAVAVAAHETGHAVQHADGYVPLKMRSAFAPVASFGSGAGPILFFIGVIMGAGAEALAGTSVSSWLIMIGIYLFAFAVLFQVITLPVEFNASSKALSFLERDGVLVGAQEVKQARKMLSAAALTYVAAALMAILQLVRFILMSQRR
ncbi:MAG: zinc metallopeptidase [Peptococcaceae bacterium]|nr:zinc metallopeptidase [Peptococcaceae bacterium]